MKEWKTRRAANGLLCVVFNTDHPKTRYVDDLGEHLAGTPSSRFCSYRPRGRFTAHVHVWAENFEKLMDVLRRRPEYKCRKFSIVGENSETIAEFDHL